MGTRSTNKRPKFLSQTGYNKLVVFLIMHTLSKEISDRLHAPSELAPLALAELFYKKLSTSPMQPPRCNGKVGTATSSNGALPTPSGLSRQYSLPLSVVGRKKQIIQTKHTTRAQLHFDMSRRRRSRLQAAPHHSKTCQRRAQKSTNTRVGTLWGSS